MTKEESLKVDSNNWNVNLSLRDYFAGIALQSIITKHGFGYEPPNAEFAYKTADQMLLERAK